MMKTGLVETTSLLRSEPTSGIPPVEICHRLTMPVWLCSKEGWLAVLGDPLLKVRSMVGPLSDGRIRIAMQTGIDILAIIIVGPRQGSRMENTCLTGPDHDEEGPRPSQRTMGLRLLRISRCQSIQHPAARPDSRLLLRPLGKPRLVLHPQISQVRLPCLRTYLDPTARSFPICSCQLHVKAILVAMSEGVSSA